MLKLHTSIYLVLFSSFFLSLCTLLPIQYNLYRTRLLDLEKAMAHHSSTLAWKIPWTEKPGRLQSMGSPELDTTERLHFDFSLSCIGEGNGNPLQCSCLENPRDGGAWWAAVYGVAKSQTRLKRLSSSSNWCVWRCLSFLLTCCFSRRTPPWNKSTVELNFYYNFGYTIP